MKFYAEVISGAKYPITSKMHFESPNWPAAARAAMTRHRANLREAKKLRQQGDDIRIKLIRMPDAEPQTE